MDWQTKKVQEFCRKNKVAFWFEDLNKVQMRRFCMRAEDGIAVDRTVDFALLDGNLLSGPMLNGMLAEIQAFRAERR